MSARLCWVHSFTTDGDATPIWTHADYNSVEEALLQAAHNELHNPGFEQYVEVDGKKVHGKAAIKKAAAAYKRTWIESSWVDPITHAGHLDSSKHLETMRGLDG